MSESYTNYEAGANSIRNVMPLPFRKTTRSVVVNVGSPADEAALLIKVYTNLGLFGPAYAEGASENLQKDITKLRASHSETPLQPLIAVRLSPEFGLSALVKNFNKRQEKFTDIWSSLWYRYQNDLSVLNRRSIGGRNDPADLAVVGMPLEADNSYGEAGLTLMNKTTRQQRRAIGRGLIANVVDWFALAEIARELGERPIDEKTFTRFAQMETVNVWDSGYVGRASSYNSHAWRYGLRAKEAARNTGVRRLLGQDIPQQPAEGL